MRTATPARRLASAVATLTLAFASHEAFAAGEPTAAEMRAAVSAKLSAINAGTRSLRQQCEAREYRTQNNTGWLYIPAR